jgi:HEAT repeat protein
VQPLSEENAIKLLASRRADDVAEAAKYLADLESLAHVQPLMEAYDRIDADGIRLDKSCRARVEIVNALGRIASPLAEPTIRRAIRTHQAAYREDTARELRAAAAIAITKVDPTGAIHDLALLLFDEDPGVAHVALSEHIFANAVVRMNAARALGALGQPAAAALLAVKLKYPGGEVPEVLAACLESFASLNPPNVLEVTAPYLKGRDPFLAGSAAAALATQCGESALDLLIDSAPQMPKECIVPLVLLITGIRSSRTGEALTNFFGDRDPKVRRAAVEGAALYPGDVVRERLTLVAKSDPDSAVRQAASATVDN